MEAAVAIRLVDVSTGLIIYSDEAKGSADLTTKLLWVSVDVPTLMPL